MIEKNLQSLVFVKHSRRISLVQRYFHLILQISFFHFTWNVSFSKNRAVIWFYLWDQYRLCGAFLLIIRWIIDHTKDERSRIYNVNTTCSPEQRVFFFLFFLWQTGRDKNVKWNCQGFIVWSAFQSNHSTNFFRPRWKSGFCRKCLQCIWSLCWR